MLSNREIVQRTKQAYDPRYAFGNLGLIKLTRQTHEPDAEGKFEAEGEIEERVKTIVEGYVLHWQCPDCGHANTEEERHDHFASEQICAYCRKISNVNF